MPTTQLRRDRWGYGYATEAMQAMLQFGFQSLGLHRISDFCDPENQASIRVMEKVGMRREGHLVQNHYTKGRWWDSVVYAILAEEWRTRQAS
jgi:[ribosomal protein S5]-alanine N-acetyltransferase